MNKAHQTPKRGVRKPNKNRKVLIRLLVVLALSVALVAATLKFGGNFIGKIGFRHSATQNQNGQSPLKKQSESEQSCLGPQCGQPDSANKPLVDAAIASYANPPKEGIAPTQAKLNALVSAMPKTDFTQLAVRVDDLATKQAIYQLNAEQGMIPASNQKLLTAVAVLASLGNNTRFSTTTKLVGADSLVLVGGGDPLLMLDEKQAAGFASAQVAKLSDLAYQTARDLKVLRVTSVKLFWDDSYFSGPSWNQNWLPGYAEEVAPISALSVNRGRDRAGLATSEDAAAKFASLLAGHGIKVVGKPAAAPANLAAGKQIAKVDSATVYQIMRHTLQFSDNFATEVMARQAAIANGKAGSFADGVAVINEKLSQLGITGLNLVDASGLARQNRVSVANFAQVIQLAYTDEKYRPMLDWLPIAGVNGSLRANRFNLDNTKAGRGWVRAKTGTLREVRSLVGYTTTADGRLVSFAVIINGSKDDWKSTVWLDDFAARLTSCGCS